jgi:hypothetical protein
VQQDHNKECVSRLESDAGILRDIDINSVQEPHVRETEADETAAEEPAGEEAAAKELTFEEPAATEEPSVIGVLEVSEDEEIHYCMKSVPVNYDWARLDPKHASGLKEWQI